MILTSLIVAAAATIAVGAVITYWDDVKQFLASAIKMAKAALDAVVVGVKVFMKKMDGYFTEVAKTYQRDRQNQWHETTTTKRVDPSEVPADILAKMNAPREEVDITQRVERELQLTL
ncbi:hypothetical protein [Exiguobacterium artemiae]|uniref:hypothetical protein n=1 Tax=Exiguobacterium artemiae TaxID=340145 RepID=UPI003CFDAAF0